MIFLSQNDLDGALDVGDIYIYGNKIRIMFVNITNEPPMYGAKIPLNRATIEHEPRPTFLTSVGKISEL